jgi:uncharacterized protein YhaN
MLEELNELERRLGEADGLAQRVDGIRRDASEFASAVDLLVRRLAPDLAGKDPAEAAEELCRRADVARRDRERCEEAERRRAELAAEAEQHAARRRAAEDELAALVRVARVTSADELERCEERWAQAQAMRREIEQLERQIRNAGDGEGLAALEREATELDASVASARSREIEAELAEIEERQNALAQQIGSLRAGFEPLQESGAAAARDDVEEHAARVDGMVERYVRVRLAVAVLEREIEQHRRQSQGPVLDRARVLFPRLTAGGYAGLHVDFRDTGPVIVCDRADGTQVDVDRLSDGTCDQLYLALRIASLEHRLAGADALPLVLDDVLIHFDDERAQAALEVLGELSERMQVLFFTHHDALRRLARSVLGPARLDEHELG